MNPPLQRPFDLQKYREQYLSFLRLEASNNQKITNAVMLLKTTGQLPVPPLDVRTTTEKLADLEGSKVQLRALLQQVTDGGIAGQIISSLDSDQIAFALQNWDTIQKDMTKKYGQGVPLSVFIVYLNKLIDDTQKAQGIRFGLQLASGNNLS
jgi:pyridoxine 5'-phosphate synthase PdxJ